MQHVALIMKLTDKFFLGRFRDQGDAKWIVITGHNGISSARGSAALWAYLVFLVTINFVTLSPDHAIHLYKMGNSQ
jgi:hypothetical protein